MGWGSGLGFRVGVRVRVLASRSESPRAHAPTQRRRCRSAPGRGTYALLVVEHVAEPALCLLALLLPSCVYLLPPLGGYTFSVRNGAAQLCLRRSRFVRDQHLWPARQRRRRLAQPYRTAVPVAIAMASCHASCTRRPRAHLLTLERGLVRLPKSHTACAVQPHRPVSRAASRDRELSHLQSPPTTTTGGGGSDR